MGRTRHDARRSVVPDRGDPRRPHPGLGPRRGDADRPLSVRRFQPEDRRAIGHDSRRDPWRGTDAVAERHAGHIHRREGLRAHPPPLAERRRPATRSADAHPAPYYIETFTFHSLGFRAIKQRFGNVELDDNKVFNLVKAQLGTDTWDIDLITSVCDTVAFCKYGLLDTTDQIGDLMDRFSIDLCEMDKKAFINLVIKTLSLDKAMTSKIDFNDMCWLPFVYNLPLGLYDFVYIDERQDLNKSQLVMAKKVCRPNTGRIIAVGDENQALYSWRLADTSIIDDLKKQDKTKTLPLPISYRCPKAIIDLAQNWVSDITCPETAIEGEVDEISLNEMYELAEPRCFILYTMLRLLNFV